MRRPLTPFVLALALTGLPLVGVGAQVAQAAPPAGSRVIPASGSGGIQTVAQGTGAFQPPEFPPPVGPEAAGVTPGPPLAPGASPVNRRQSAPSSQGEEVASAAVAGAGEASAAATLGVSFDGLDHFDQRTANGGNQFSVEPPDQGLCVGNGFVLETVNSVMRIFDTSGNPVSGVVDQNTFYGYPPAINRTTGKSGPFVTDPSCLYDADVSRWFHVVLTLETKKATGDFTGKNHLDLAVSDSPDPTGSWTIYRIPVQDDGTQGTPNHHCSQGPCIGDYPHIGADANGFYITTNEYSFFGPEFKAAQIYAFSKQALAATPKQLAMQQFDTKGMGFNGQPGFTVWPATGPQGSSSPANGGTQFFLSSDAARGGKRHAGRHQQHAGAGVVPDRYEHARSEAAGPRPRPQDRPGRPVLAAARCPSSRRATRRCASASTTPTGRRRRARAAGACSSPRSPRTTRCSRPSTRTTAGCSRSGTPTASSSARSDTGVKISGDSLAGIDWFVIDPAATSVVSTGFLATANNNLTYPAIATSATGSGVMAFTLVGENDFPSAAYAPIDATGVGDHPGGRGRRRSARRVQRLQGLRRPAPAALG